MSCIIPYFVAVWPHADSSAGRRKRIADAADSAYRSPFRGKLAAKAVDEDAKQIVAYGGVLAPQLHGKPVAVERFATPRREKPQKRDFPVAKLRSLARGAAHRALCRPYSPLSEAEIAAWIGGARPS